MPDPTDKLPLSLTRQLDLLCDQFEQALDTGQLPKIAPFLQQMDAVGQPRLLTELVEIERDYWQSQKVSKPGQKVVERHPDLATRIAPILNDLETQAHSTEVPADASPTDCRTETTEGLHVRCPKCGNRLELLVDAELTGIPCPACGSHFSVSGYADDAEHGNAISHIGQFELIDRLGIGSFGTVWKARDTELDRIVTVKIPRRSESEEENEKFLREARSAAQLKHPNIVSVHEVGRDQDRIYIVSDFIQGVPLSTVLEGGRLGLRESVQLLVKIAEALEHAHQKGVIHRDIKPSNVILDDAGQPHLTDFGLAKRETGEATMTLEGQVLGTPAYMSPEQAQGDAHQAGRQSDIYSMGVMLFQLLTGELPFRGSAQMLLHQAIHEPAPSPRRLDQDVSRDMETMTLKCLEKEPTLRYPTAQQLADDLNRYLRNEPISARPLKPWQRSWRWCQRRTQQAGFRAAILGLLVAAVVAGGSALWVRHAQRLALESDKKARMAEENADQQTARLASLEYTNQMIAAYSAWQKGWPTQAKRQLHLAQPTLDPSAKRGFEWRLLKSLTQPPQPLVLAGHEGAVNEVAVFPDQRRVASVGVDGMLKIWDTIAGVCLNTIDFGQELPGIDLAAGGLHSVAISPDGRYVAAGADVVGICDVQQKNPVRELLRVEHNVESLAFSSDGQQLAAGVRYDKILLVSLAGERINQIPCATRVNSLEYLGKQQQWLVPHSEMVKAPSFLQLWNEDLSQAMHTYGREKFPGQSGLNVGRISPNGRTIAAGSQVGSQVGLLDFKTGQVVATAPDYREFLLDICFSPDGQTLAIGYANGSVRCLRLHKPNNGPIIFAPQAQTFRAHQGDTRCLRFVNPETLVTCGEDGLLKVWQPFQVPGRIALNTETALPSSARFTPDGKYLLTAHRWNSTLSMYDTTTGERLYHRIFPSPATAVQNSMSQQVAVHSANSQQVYILNHQLQDLFTIDCPHPVSEIDISPDGNFLATIDQDEIILYHMENEQLASRHSLANTGQAIKYSHHGEWLAYGGNNNLLGLWNLTQTGQSVELTCTSSTCCLAFSSDDQLLATGHTDGIVRLWQIEGAKLLAEFVGHDSLVAHVHFSPDGRTLISNDRKGISRVWSIAQQRCLGVLDQLILEISPNGRHMVISYFDKDADFPTTFIQSF